MACKNFHVLILPLFFSASEMDTEALWRDFESIVCDIWCSEIKRVFVFPCDYSY